MCVSVYVRVYVFVVYLSMHVWYCLKHGSQCLFHVFETGKQSNHGSKSASCRLAKTGPGVDIPEIRSQLFGNEGSQSGICIQTKKSCLGKQSCGSSVSEQSFAVKNAKKRTERMKESVCNLRSAAVITCTSSTPASGHFCAALRLGFLFYLFIYFCRLGRLLRCKADSLEIHIYKRFLTRISRTKRAWLRESNRFSFVFGVRQESSRTAPRAKQKNPLLCSVEDSAFYFKWDKFYFPLELVVNDVALITDVTVNADKLFRITIINQNQPTHYSLALLPNDVFCDAT